MSLINQMLKDLDARHSTTAHPAFAAPHGIALTGDNAIHRASPRVLAARVAGALVLASVCYYGVRWLYIDFPRDDVDQAVALKEVLEPVPVAVPEISAAIPATDLSVAETGTSVQDNVPVEPDTTPEIEMLPEVDPVIVNPKPIKTITPAQKADRLFAQAELALATQDRQKGEILLRQALFEHPQDLNTRTRLAALLVENRNDAAAERLLLQGITSTGYRLELTKPYAQLLAARGALDEALRSLDSVATQGMNDAEWHALRAAILYRQERYRESINAYKTALQDRPTEGLWWTGLAIALEHDLQPRNALSAYRRSARLQLTSAVRGYVDQRIQALQTTDGP